MCRNKTVLNKGLLYIYQKDLPHRSARVRESVVFLRLFCRERVVLGKVFNFASHVTFIHNAQNFKIKTSGKMM
jgi:hypothetical protein